jgi:hypothetical protein
MESDYFIDTPCLVYRIALDHMGTILENLLEKAKLATAPPRLIKRFPFEKDLHLMACLCREEHIQSRGTFFLTRPQIQKMLGIPEDRISRYFGILYSEGFLLIVEKGRMDNGRRLGNRYRWVESDETNPTPDESICLDDYIPWP